MLLFFVVFIFIILHIQGLARFIFFGTSETTYYTFTTTYLYNRSIATQSLIISCACAAGFALGYALFYRKRNQPRIDPAVKVDLKPFRTAIALFIVTGVLQIISDTILVVITRLDYNTIVDIKFNHPFAFQSRTIFLVLFSYLLLNIPFAQLWKRREFRFFRLITLLYMVFTVLLQFRSEIFEFAAIACFAHLMWNGDKVKLKYVVLVICSLLGPNLIVLGRLGFPTDPAVLMKGLFSFEYSTLFNNILSEAVSKGQDLRNGITFLPSLVLLIPSPLRDVLGIEVAKSTYYADIASSADVLGGGFSFVAEMFSNFGWFAPLVFAVLGALIGKMNSGASRVGQVSMVYATAPLIYEYFILVFRNDFGVFVKSVIQIFVIALLIEFVRRLKLVQGPVKPRLELNAISNVRGSA
jgi:hypothetical protein